MVSMTADGENLARYPGFSCFKSYAPIRYPRRWFRTALIDVALDPSILRIGPSPIQGHRLPLNGQFSFWTLQGTGSNLVVLAEHPCDVSSLAERISVSVVTRSSLTQQPMAGLRKDVWSHKRNSLPFGALFRMLEIVTRTPDGSTLGNLCSIRYVDVADPLATICSFIVNGYLQVDLRRGWSEFTRLTPGPMAKSLMTPGVFAKQVPSEWLARLDFNQAPRSL